MISNDFGWWKSCTLATSFLAVMFPRIKHTLTTISWNKMYTFYINVQKLCLLHCTFAYCPLDSYTKSQSNKHQETEQWVQWIKLNLRQNKQPTNLHKKLNQDEEELHISQSQNQFIIKLASKSWSNFYKIWYNKNKHTCLLRCFFKRFRNTLNERTFPDRAIQQSVCNVTLLKKIE